MEYLQQSFSVKFEFKVFFTSGLFNSNNHVLKDYLQQSGGVAPRKVMFVVDQGILDVRKKLIADIKEYFDEHPVAQLVPEFIQIPGGEVVKNDPVYLSQILNAINEHRMDRHSYIAAIGGGSVLDLVGYAAAIAHRGIRHIRIPTTVLSQNDSGVGVKNGINYYGKKNFLGTFAPPSAVFNDEQYLTALSDRDWLAGISEAVKVALIRDAAFFDWLEQNAKALRSRDSQAMRYLVYRCAELHMQHIASGDPFEKGSSRPLDFGHWSAHKLEQITNFTVRHGEAVSMGMALDIAYSFLAGYLSEQEAIRILKLLRAFHFELTHPQMDLEQNSSIFNGLEEFREHLGGELTIMLLEGIGKGIEVHEMDRQLLIQATDYLRSFGKL